MSLHSSGFLSCIQIPVKAKIINISLVLLILFKLVLSFIQQARISLDGDMASIIVPSKSYEKVMQDPFALSVLLKHESYAAPNRSFAHWMMAGYFRTVPFFMQNFTNKIDSIYASVALAKVLMQAFLLYLLASLAGGTRKIRSREFLFPAVLISFLFQTAEFNQYIGVIDRSITYAFFYALPMSFLVLFFQMLFFIEKNGGWKNAGIIRKITLIALPVLISLSGPLNPGVALIVCVLIFCNEFWKTKNSNENVISNVFGRLKQIPQSIRITFPILILLSMYSWYIGQFNSENFNFSLPIKERYLRMFDVMPDFFFGNSALPVLILFILLNYIFLRFTPNTKERSDVFQSGKLILIFSLVYLLLLPLGGYRGYRPTILRWDTFVPVYICLYFLAGYTSVVLFKQILPQTRKIQFVWLFSFCVYFFIPDASLYKDNKYERLRLKDLANSQEEMVELKNDCTVMAWVLLRDYRESELNCKLLKYWGVIEKPRFYFQK